MARTSLQIIAESLAKRHGLTQKEAERFWRLPSRCFMRAWMPTSR